METKKCKGTCGQVKNIIEFSLRSDNGHYNSKCKKCVKEYYDLYRKEKADKIKCLQQEHYNKNKAVILQNKKVYYKNNKESIVIANRNYYEKNKEAIRSRHKCYYIKNRSKILRSKKAYAFKNRKRLSEYTIRYFRVRRSNDPAFALRCDLSTMIGKSLRLNSESKNGKSIIKHLPFSIESLKNHIESQFETWMNWDNRGRYDAITWDDNDQSTWTWQLDHIVPHSTFYYTSMDDQVFKECWALSNLRPLSSKINNADGVSRIRHK